MLLGLKTPAAFLNELAQHSHWHGSKKWKSSVRCHVAGGSRALMENLQLEKKRESFENP